MGRYKLCDILRIEGLGNKTPIECKETGGHSGFTVDKTYKVYTSNYNNGPRVYDDNREQWFNFHEEIADAVFYISSKYIPSGAAKDLRSMFNPKKKASREFPTVPDPVKDRLLNPTDSDFARQEAKAVAMAMNYGMSARSFAEATTGNTANLIELPSGFETNDHILETLRAKGGNMERKEYCRMINRLNGVSLADEKLVELRQEASEEKTIRINLVSLLEKSDTIKNLSLGKKAIVRTIDVSQTCVQLSVSLGDVTREETGAVLKAFKEMVDKQ